MVGEQRVRARPSGEGGRWEALRRELAGEAPLEAVSGGIGGTREAVGGTKRPSLAQRAARAAARAAEAVERDEHGAAAPPTVEEPRRRTTDHGGGGRTAPGETGIVPDLLSVPFSPGAVDGINPAVPGSRSTPVKGPHTERVGAGAAARAAARAAEAVTRDEQGGTGAAAAPPTVEEPRRRTTDHGERTAPGESGIVPDLLVPGINPAGPGSSRSTPVVKGPHTDAVDPEPSSWSPWEEERRVLEKERGERERRRRWLEQVRRGPIPAELQPDPSWADGNMRIRKLERDQTTFDLWVFCFF